MLYGLIFFRSIWYPINLLAGSLYDAPAIPTMELSFMHFHLGWFLFALAMHITMCLLVGLLYGAMLPMLPTRPIVLGWHHRAAAVDGPALSHPRLRKSVARRKDQLGMVRGIAGGIRRSRWTGGGAAEQGVDDGEPAAGHARRN